MARAIAGSTVITKNTRTDIYQENEIDRIISAQKARSAQAFPIASFTGEDDAYNIYVYAFTTNTKMNDSDYENVPGISEIAVIGKADFTDPSPAPNDTYGPYSPILSGSIRLTLTKSK